MSKGLSDAERDSLTECECGHYANEHSTTGCLANVYDEDGQAEEPSLCACVHSPTAINRHAIEAIVAAREAAARQAGRAEVVARVEAGIDALDEWFQTFRPDNYRTGQWHLAPAFREVNYRDAMNALMKRINEYETDLRALVAEFAPEATSEARP